MSSQPKQHESPGLSYPIMMYSTDTRRVEEQQGRWWALRWQCEAFYATGYGTISRLTWMSRDHDDDVGRRSIRFKSRSFKRQGLIKLEPHNRQNRFGQKDHDSGRQKPLFLFIILTGRLLSLWLTGHYHVLLPETWTKIASTLASANSGWMKIYWKIQDMSRYCQTSGDSETMLSFWELQST